MLSRKKLADQANAVHEAGHAVSIWTEPLLLGVKKVTIVFNPENGNLGGVTPKHKKWLRSLTSRQLLRALIRTFLAGRIAEEICFGEPFAGSYDDIETATALAKRLVAHEGMHDGVGMVALGETAESEHVKKLVDKAIVAVLDACYREEKKRLTRRKQDILKVAFALLERKTLKKRDLKKLLGKRPKAHVPIAELKRRPGRTNARRK